jgi:hypothetical protein
VLQRSHVPHPTALHQGAQQRGPGLPASGNRCVAAVQMDPPLTSIEPPEPGQPLLPLERSDAAHQTVSGYWNEWDMPGPNLQEQ